MVQLEGVLRGDNGDRRAALAILLRDFLGDHLPHVGAAVGIYAILHVHDNQLIGDVHRTRHRAHDRRRIQRSGKRDELFIIIKRLCKNNYQLWSAIGANTRFFL